MFQHTSNVLEQILMDIWLLLLLARRMIEINYLVLQMLAGKVIKTAFASLKNVLILLQSFERGWTIALNKIIKLFYIRIQNDIDIKKLDISYFQLIIRQCLKVSNFLPKRQIVTLL